MYIEQLALEIASWAREQKGVLWWKFFFDWRVDKLRDPRFVFPALASQLGELVQFEGRYKRALYEALKEDNKATLESLQSQFDRLICGPLLACRGGRPTLIVLDALDEYLFMDHAKEMLRILLQSSAALRSAGQNLRILHYKYAGGALSFHVQIAGRNLD